MDYKVIGARVKARRKLMGITQERLAEVIDTSVVTISAIENAKIHLTLGTMVSIANALGCTVDDFVEGYLEHKVHCVHMALVVLLSDCSRHEQVLLCNMLRALKNVMRDTLDAKDLECVPKTSFIKRKRGK